MDPPDVLRLCAVDEPRLDEPDVLRFEVPEEPRADVRGVLRGEYADELRLSTDEMPEALFLPALRSLEKRSVPFAAEKGSSARRLVSGMIGCIFVCGFIAPELAAVIIISYYNKE